MLYLSDRMTPLSRHVPVCSENPPHTCSFNGYMGSVGNYCKYVTEVGTWLTPQSGNAGTRTKCLARGHFRCLPTRASKSASVVFSSLRLPLIPPPLLLSSLPFLPLGSSSCSSCSRTPPPPIQTAPPLPPLRRPPPPLTTIAARRGKRGRRKRRRTRRRGNGNGSTSPPKPVTAQIQIECSEHAGARTCRLRALNVGRDCE